MTLNQETTPDQLLESFRGRSFKSIILFTIIVHLVILGGSSIPYLLKSFSGKADSKLTEAERTEMAAREATTAIRDIATKHGIKPQDLSSRIADGTPRAPTANTPAPADESAPEAPPEPKSAIEEQLDVKVDGPQVPPIPTEEAEEDDLFR